MTGVQTCALPIFFNTHLDMSKHTNKIREEEKWLREVCKDNPDHFDLIQQTVKIVKTKSLMVRKRGLQTDIENMLDDYINPQQAATTNEEAVAAKQGSLL